MSYIKTFVSTKDYVKLVKICVYIFSVAFKILPLLKKGLTMKQMLVIMVIRKKVTLWLHAGSRSGLLNQLILGMHKGKRMSFMSENREKNYVTKTDLEVLWPKTLQKSSKKFSGLTGSVTVGDVGSYECRVDFFKSPTHNSFVNLSVIELPRKLTILSGPREVSQEGTLGPFRENQPLTLTCRAEGGAPAPNVTWHRGGDLLDGTWSQEGPRRVRNDVEVNSLSRLWHNETISCRATNTLLAHPVTAHVTIDMYLRPTSVMLTGPGPTLEGETVRFRCTSEGSKPPAVLSWAFAGVPIQGERENTHYGSTTSSTLMVAVNRTNDGVEVTCTAANPAMPNDYISDSTSLTVHYSPAVKATLGRPFVPKQLKEGDDVYFDCEVQANPPATQVTWYHEGMAVVQNLSVGVVLSGDSLVLQKVDRRRAGSYHCAATNTIATQTSEIVDLRIRYHPDCHTSPTTYFIFDKPINASCTIAAYPLVTSVYWQWHNSTENITTQPVSSNGDKVTAQLLVDPTETTEERVLKCWAHNLMGEQERECKFSVKVAQMPAPLSSCRLVNITASSLSLTCQRPNSPAAGTTLYRAEVYLENGTLFANVTSERPSFNVSQLDSGTSYQIKVYVSHGPVTSQPVLVSGYTSRTSRRGHSEGSSTVSISGTAGNIGAILGGVVTMLVVAAVIWLRHRHMRNIHRGINDPHSTKDETAIPTIAQEDSNPDVVPILEEDVYSASPVDQSQASSVPPPKSASVYTISHQVTGDTRHLGSYCQRSIIGQPPISSQDCYEQTCSPTINIVVDESDFSLISESYPQSPNELALSEMNSLYQNKCQMQDGESSRSSSRLQLQINDHPFSDHSGTLSPEPGRISDISSLVEEEQTIFSKCQGKTDSDFYHREDVYRRVDQLVNSEESIVK
ncbi:unnamed protein product, partial [Meganyctiphanes norvegica]